MGYDPQKKQDLREARENDRKEKAQKILDKYGAGETGKTANQVKNLTKSATPRGIISLLGSINFFSDWMYGLALFAAILKDLLDIVEATGIGYILVVVTTFCTGIFIAMMMLLGSFSNNSGGKKQQKIIRSWLVLFGGTIIELIPGIDFVPIETLTVIIIYVLLLSSRKQNKEEYEKNSRLNEAESNYA